MVNKSNVQTKKLDIAKNGLLYGQVTRNVQIWSELWSDITLSTKFNRFGQRYVPFVTTQWEHGLKGGGGIKPSCPGSSTKKELAL